MRTQESAGLRAILTSDLDMAAMVVWTYLRWASTTRTAGPAALQKAFKGTAVDWQTGIEILEEMELVEKRDAPFGGTVWRVLDPVVTAKKKMDKSVPNADVATNMLIEVYQDMREDRRFSRWALTPACMKRMSELSVWLRSQGVDAREYLDFVFDLYKRVIKEAPVPSPGHLVGPFAQSNWLNRAQDGGKQAKAKTSHAGDSYRPAKAIRRELERLGCEEELDASQLRYVDDLSDAAMSDPDTVIPERWADIVGLLLKEKRRAARS